MSSEHMQGGHSVPPAPLPWPAGAAYGALGFALAFAAMPLYVVLPHHYASDGGLPLATVGSILMLVRVADALTEPWLGRASDALFARHVHVVWGVGACMAALQWLGWGGVFFPPVQGSSPVLAVVLALGLLVTSMSHSLLSILHHAWGVRLGGSALQRSRVVSWREGAGLLGVIAASALSVAVGLSLTWGVFGVALGLGLWSWRRAPQPAQVLRCNVSPMPIWAPLAQPAFRQLLAVFVCNGIASAIPAALLLFFAQDRLQASGAATAVCLVLYFSCGAASIPLWLRGLRRWGLAWSWWLGMVLSIVCFAGTAGLAAGQWPLFAVICTCTGMALGADVVMPGALLSQLIAQQGAQGQHEGVYVGWWSLASKLNLALAAGAALPVLQWLGYVPGTQEAQALQYLTWTYAALPCALKLVAAGVLYRVLIRRAQAHA